MNVLALDLGTKTGWAIRSRGIARSGTVSFAPRVREGAGQRWIKFRRFLAETAAEADLGAIYFEDVKAHGQGAVLAAHVYGGFLAHLELWAELNRIPLHGIGVGTVKKHWTGKGNAKKSDMLRVARERGLRPVDDNEADALALLDYALCDQGEHTPTPIEASLVDTVFRVGSVFPGVGVSPFEDGA